MYGWKFYDVETIDNETDKMVRIESFEELEQAEKYAVSRIKNKLLDYNEQLVLIKRRYNNDRELINQEFIRVFDNSYDEELENLFKGGVKK
jgi:hypothetical protein